MDARSARFVLKKRRYDPVARGDISARSKRPTQSRSTKGLPLQAVFDLD
jgi:hypothetical protein